MKVRKSPHVRLMQSLPAPSMDQAPDGIVDLDRIKTGAHARAPEALLPLPGDEITMSFGDYVWARQPFVDRFQPFFLPAIQLGRQLGLEVALAYVVHRGGIVYPSDVFWVTVPAIEHEDPRMAPPVIERTYLDILSLRGFSGDATITIDPWLLMAQEQAVWLDVDLTSPDDTVTTIALIDGERVTENMLANGIEATLQRSTLENAEEGTTVTLRLRVSFDDSGDESRAIRFPSQSYRVTHEVVEVPSDFSEANSEPILIALGAPVRLENGVVLTKVESVKIELLSPYNVEGPIVGGHLKLREGPVDVRPPVSATHFHLDLVAQGRVLFEIYEDENRVHSFIQEPTDGMQVQYTSERPFTSIRVYYDKYWTETALLDNVVFRT